MVSYACESWKSTQLIKKKLDASENRCHRRLLNIHTGANLKQLHQLGKKQHKSIVMEYDAPRKAGTQRRPWLFLCLPPLPISLARYLRTLASTN